MNKKYTIPVIVRTQDNGDGGYTIRAYNNEEELLNDHPKSREWKEVDGKYVDVKVELTEEQKQEILTEDDPYENGYISKETVEVEILEDGTARLSGPIVFHAGQ